MMGTLRRWLFPATGLGILSNRNIAYCEDVINCKPKDDCPEPEAKPKKCKKKKCDDRTELEKCVANCRENFEEAQTALEQYSEQARDFVRCNTRSLMRNVNYLQDCAPEDVKIGVIIGSGLFGMLLGFRRRMFRRLLYGTLAATTAAAIIYPCEARLIANEAGSIGKRYAILAYKFVNPAKKECKKKKVEKKDCGTNTD